nr:immunoglobulin light chain junction region [Macaca mulatta]MOV72426.1 immunoglobulin light chain junction region [Macaca mulatta]MOV72979.1 immunoglobulin light chain junction region [Macaca mulatta]
DYYCGSYRRGSTWVF